MAGRVFPYETKQGRRYGYMHALPADAQGKIHQKKKRAFERKKEADLEIIGRVVWAGKKL